MDSSGDQHLHIDHNIFKRRLDLEGTPIDAAKKENIQVTTKKENIVIIIKDDKYMVMS